MKRSWRNKRPLLSKVSSSESEPRCTGTESSSSLNKAAACVGKKKKHLNKIMSSSKMCKKEILQIQKVYFIKALCWSWFGLRFLRLHGRTKSPALQRSDWSTHPQKARRECRSTSFTSAAQFASVFLSPSAEPRACDAPRPALLAAPTSLSFAGP